MTETANKTPEICVVGLVYFELHLSPEDLPRSPGVEQFVDELPVGAGGALNSASAAAALGRKTHLAHPAGDGLTDAAVRTAIDRIDVSTTTWATDADPAISVVFTRDGDRSFLSAADPESLSRAPDLPTASWIHVPGLREANALRDQLQRVRQRGSRISVSASWVPEELDRLSEPNERCWDLLVLNHEEYERALGTETLEPRRLARAAPNVVVTEGGRGITAHLDGGDYRVELDPLDPVELVEPDEPFDTTGAGDAFCAGLLDARLDDMSPRAALRHAAEVAGRTLRQYGGVVEDAALFDDLSSGDVDR